MKCSLLFLIFSFISLFSYSNYDCTYQTINDSLKLKFSKVFYKDYNYYGTDFKKVSSNKWKNYFEVSGTRFLEYDLTKPRKVYLKKTSKPFNGFLFQKNDKRIIIEYINGLPNGLVKDYYSDRKIKEIFYFEEGIILKKERYYNNGQISHSHKYLNGEVFYKESYYENGRLKSQWKKNETKNWNKKGDLRVSSSFKNDSIQTYKSTFNGRIIFYEKYLNGELVERERSYNKDAEFPGGMAKLHYHLAENIQYPEMAKENGVHGRVFVQFVVSNDGTIRNVKVLKSRLSNFKEADYNGDMGIYLEKEAIRVVKSMPCWEPAWMNGIRVPSIYTLPIKFNIPSW